MFQLTVSAIGKDARSPSSLLADEYIERAQHLARSQGMAGPSLKVFEAPKALSGKVRQEKEADLLISSLPQGGEIVMLDERGKNLSSREFAGVIQAVRDRQGRGLHFLIGGADGFLSDMAKRVAPCPVQKIAFGQATWPHLLVRAMLAEQIYRAMTVLAGHPYHRD